LEAGGVVIGDVPSWRVDHMPYGGVKDSGLGREGIRFAIEDMTEIRLFSSPYSLGVIDQDRSRWIETKAA
jgi:acyl-CoA reductase-like NAD-dependent aldehyde dehydrogenase